MWTKFIAGAALFLSISLTSSVVSAEEIKKQYLIGFENQLQVTEFLEATEKGNDQVSLFAEVNNDTVEMELLYEFEEIPVVSVELSPEDVQSLKKDPSIAYVEEDVEVKIANQTTPWGITRVQAPTALNRGFTGSGVRVAVLDTGIATHSDLNIRGGVSFVSGEPGYQDGNGHGTHVAGTIAALNNSIGVIGVAPNAELYAVKVLGANGSGSVSAIAQGLQWSAQNNMHIANLSLGSPTGSQTLELAVNQANSAGVLVVAASGNNGSGTVSYPARYTNALAVGATDQNNNRASFSQYGTGLNIVAPGVGVQSTYPGNRYASLNGTSMATPHVAGVAALVKQKNPSWSNTQIRNHLLNTATSLGSSTQFGSGLVNAEAATR
ncbi:S8 family serine peptidase [Alkalihalobacillus pseudalcaliphilus]|uniref:S8 family serine peptidase n=1 Tax=Alkalihalobacillus pseudalcaliphilus TaxID=79884 RepID=UPI0023617A64|nr:S8 family serine peptidase [Alkalihalobacillus pseudalcaliphilus]